MAEEESTQGQSNQTGRRGRRLKPRSEVWERFTRYTGADGKQKAKCNRCGKEYAYHGTKNQKKHIDEGCAGQEPADAGAEQEPQPLPGLAVEEQAHHGSSPGLDEEAAWKDLARMITLGGHDPSVVEDKYFRSFVRRLNPVFKLPSRQVIKEMCDDVFTESRTQVLRGEEASSDRQRLMQSECESVRKETCPSAGGGTTTIAAAATSPAQIAASTLLLPSQAQVACSKVREFEFRPTVSQYMDAPSAHHGATNKVYFQIRLDKLLSLGPDEHQATVSNPSLEMIDLSKKISSLMMSNDEWSNLLKMAVGNEPSTDDQQEQFAENLIKEKLHVWLLNKFGMGGKGPSVLDDEGQGVLHLSAALGYNWAIRPTLAAGVHINFRDFHGWTALHWAAFCGRERTVVALIALGAAPGALTDPTPDFPGSTPADLASANGQKGISGFLAESSLTSHLQALNLKEANMAEISGLPGIGDVTERDSLQPPSADSLGPLRNAVQAAARIYQVFRVQSFKRNQAAQYEDDQGGMSDERALSLISVPKSGQLDPLQSAATRIQNKFRGWKGRNEFILIRQRIVKIQAHVRGHQVRKRYEKIVWSVGILEKVILRWRRRGAGLRGFRCTEGSMEGSSGGTSSSLVQDKPSGDDYDFLQEGRKQTEEGLEKSLARVKSMTQYPEARDQYQRILTVVSKMLESQAVQEKMLEESAEMDEGNSPSEFKELWDDDTPTPGYF